jgi:Second Messenger Oligonucleotide or Dinucleotide Synthetase domain
MSVLSYLTQRASGAVLSEDERSSISTSIATLKTRLDSYFTVSGDGLRNHFRFGSSTRGTILPRRIDSNSDIDYMVVFEKGGLNPQSYLDRLRRFVEQKYSTSEIYQSSPTIALELNHIKFELVPALYSYGETYQIPDGPNAWRSSSPKDFSDILEARNGQEGSMLKPTIRLAKIWNTKNDYVFDSYLFEKWISELYYSDKSNQKTYLFNVFDNVSATQQAQWRNDRITRAKNVVAAVRKFERDEMPVSAEVEVKKLIAE